MGNAEDNYEISERGEDVDEEVEQAEEEEEEKHEPAWCADYLDELAKQVLIDPDTIFGSRVPACETMQIFPDELYNVISQEPPKRRRGSSGAWGTDRLTRSEVLDYKKRMGQQKSWESDEMLAAKVKTTKTPVAGSAGKLGAFGGG